MEAEERKVLASGESVVNVCLHAFTVSIAREHSTGKSVRGGWGVEGLVAPLGPKKEGL